MIKIYFIYLIVIILFIILCLLYNKHDYSNELHDIHYLSSKYKNCYRRNPLDCGTKYEGYTKIISKYTS